MTEPQRAAAERPTVAVLLIGNELLSGKIRDENGWFLSQVCRRRGMELREIAVVPDEIETIGEALLRLLGDVPLVFTSGGVGPTHDDVTMEAIAKATDRPLVRNAQMEAILAKYYGGEAREAALRMADIPDGTQLRALPGWPVLRLDLDEGEIFGERPPLPHPGRIYILPGIPTLLRSKVEALEALPDELPPRRDWILVELHTATDESAMAPHLDAVVAEFPEVEIGSYPRWEADDSGRLRVRVKLTFEAAEEAPARNARDALSARLDPERLLDGPGAGPRPTDDQ